MFSNMTAREHLRLCGAVPVEKIEDLLEKEEALEEMEGIDAHISEAMAQYPAEDFLQGPINRMHELAKRLRGDNRAELLGIIEQLDDIAQCTFNSADYGRSELNAVIKTIEGVK